MAEIWEKLKSQWQRKFGGDGDIDIEGMLFLIGVQELGFGPKKFKKDEKTNLMHVAICTVLASYGYYKPLGRDAQGWPHFEALKQLPHLKPGEQSWLMKEAIIDYALQNDLLES